MSKWEHFSRKETTQLEKKYLHPFLPKVAHRVPNNGTDSRRKIGKNIATIVYSSRGETTEEKKPTQKCIREINGASSRTTITYHLLYLHAFRIYTHTKVTLFHLSTPP